MSPGVNYALRHKSGQPDRLIETQRQRHAALYSGLMDDPNLIHLL